MQVCLSTPPNAPPAPVIRITVAPEARATEVIFLSLSRRSPDTAATITRAGRSFAGAKGIGLRFDDFTFLSQAEGFIQLSSISGKSHAASSVQGARVGWMLHQADGDLLLAG